MTADDKDTRTRILDTAESLFAEHGFAATSLRQITTAAGVNLAAVNYHFGSKEELVHEVFSRRLGPINRRRLELLDACEERAAKTGRKPRLEEVIRALIEPPLRLRTDPTGVAVTKLLSRTYTEPRHQTLEIFVDQFSEIAKRFIVAFQKALPDLPDAEVWWRAHFTIGAMAHTMASAETLEFFSGGRCNLDDVDATITRMVKFLAAGFRSVVPETADTGAKTGTRTARLGGKR